MKNLEPIPKVTRPRNESVHFEFPRASFTLEIRPPDGPTSVHRIEIAEETWRKSFAPLPRERELYFCVDAQAKAAQMAEMRHHIARAIAEQLAEKILEAIERRDTRNGYPPENAPHGR